MQKRLTVSILDKNYTFTTDEQVDDIERAAMRVDHFLRSPSPSHLHNTNETAAIVTALRFALELGKYERTLEEYERTVQRITQALDKPM